MRIAINTGGGDAPGLNAVIRAVTIAALEEGWEVFGIQRGYDGVFQEGGVFPLTRESVRGITHLGGTILGTTNRGNPLKWPISRSDGTVDLVDRSDEVISRLRRRGIDALIAVGGDGSLGIAAHLASKGLHVIGVPKTIDNDLAATSMTFGFLTAVEAATDAIDKLHSTAESHQRVMVLEVMGRTAGWIALFSGLAGTADVILIPEIPYSFEKVCAQIQERYARGREFAIVVVAEGAVEKGGEAIYIERASAGRSGRLGGVGEYLAQRIQDATGRETRSLVLGHLQRGGSPIAYDRILALRFGAAAVHLAKQGHFGCMVSLDPPDVKAVPLAEATARIKHVPLDGDVIRAVRALGVCLGD